MAALYRNAVALAGLLALASGCAPKVRVEVPPQPAVPLSQGRVAVVATSRECRSVADSLVERLNSQGALVVDPRSPVRLEISLCERPLTSVVEVRIGPEADQRRLVLEGRAHAVLTLRVDEQEAAFLLGASATVIRGGWEDRDLPALSRTALRDLDRGVAADLAEQLRPIPRIADRRVYPNAPEGSARSWTTRAVAAERDGLLREARLYAEKAHAARPTERTAAYLEELGRRLPMDEEKP